MRQVSRPGVSERRSAATAEVTRGEPRPGPCRDRASLCCCPWIAIRFAIIGSGWRTEFYLRVARALPEMFEITGVQTRDAERAAAIAHDWAVPGTLTTDELLAADPAFVVVSVPWAVTPTLLRELSERGVPVLTETPPAPDIDGLRALQPLSDAGARIQVAEQYQFQPLHAARLALAASGRLGTVSEAQLSVAHGYHGIDLMRRFLDLDDDAPATIRGDALRVAHRGRTRPRRPTDHGHDLGVRARPSRGSTSVTGWGSWTSPTSSTSRGSAPCGCSSAATGARSPTRPSGTSRTSPRPSRSR